MTRPSALPHLADATDLERWADRVDARYGFAQLVRRLIRDENDQVQHIEMRSGEGANLPGYDGVVEALRRSSFVPEGVSVWELGVGARPAEKANSDYGSRTEDSLGIDKASTTFVFGTLRRWSGKGEWVARRREEGHWRDVWAFDADDLERLLDEHPSVHYRLSEELGMPASGVQTLEDWWARYSAVFSPPLTIPLVLAGRADAAAELARRLTLEVGRTFVRAPSVDDGLAFVGCTMLAADADASSTLLSKSLLVHDGASLRRLDTTSSLLILLPYEEELRRQAHLVRNHHVVCIVTEGGTADIELPPLDFAELESEFRARGVVEPDLSRFVRAAHHSLESLLRVSSASVQPEPEYWIDELDGVAVRRAWLAGAWNSRRSGDVDALEALAAEPYLTLEERLRSSAARPDPLFTVVGSSWAVTSPSDSWPTASREIGDSDLDALEVTVQTVLTAVDPKLDLPIDERWAAAIHGKVPVHSSELRRGLARSLALLAARGDELRLSTGRSSGVWVEYVLAQLFERVRDDTTAQLWTSLADVLPLLAEAAPDVFLRAVEAGTEGREPLLAKTFQDERGELSVSSAHTGMLWGLETVAWSGTYLGFASELLARLAEIDPGGRLSNRPANSLVEIYKPWLPQTSADADTRFAVLEALLDKHRDVAWKLLLELLPSQSAIGMNTHRPEFRAWTTDEDGGPTRADYIAFIERIAAVLIEVADAEPARWIELVAAFDRLPPSARTAALRALGTLDASSFDDSARDAFWQATDSLIRHHRHYSEAEWALREDVLSPLSEVSRRFRPGSPTTAAAWLFDDWHPDLIVDGSDSDPDLYESVLRNARARGVGEVLGTEGLNGVFELASRVSLPWAVGASLADNADGFTEDDQVVGLLDSTDPRLRSLAQGFAGARTRTDSEWAWSWVGRMSGRSTVQARLLLEIRDLESAWQRADELGSEVSRAYWAEFVPYGRGPQFAEVGDAARHLFEHGRVAMAIDGLSMYLETVAESVETELIITLLNALGVNPDPDIHRVSDYDVSRLLQVLRDRGLSDAEVAALEWRFIPILGRDRQTPSLERLLAESPSAFVDLVTMIFRAASDRSDEVPKDRTEETRAAASNAYRILREWQRVPGTDDEGIVHQDRLEAWLDDARTLLAESDRLEIGELQFGEVLAHSPSDEDGSFPTLAVRNVLESAPNDRLGRGFAIGLFNKRGVTTRGLTEGGEQEYRLAREYEGWASRIDSTHPRTAGILRSVADGYRAQGRRNDEEAERFLQGLGH
jgi:hypothetical protein